MRYPLVQRSMGDCCCPSVFRIILFFYACYFFPKICAFHTWMHVWLSSCTILTFCNTQHRWPYLLWIIKPQEIFCTISVRIWNIPPKMTSCLIMSYLELCKELQSELIKNLPSSCSFLEWISECYEVFFKPLLVAITWRFLEESIQESHFSSISANRFQPWSSV